MLKDQDEYLVYRVITHMPVPTLRRIVSRPEGRVMPLDELPQAYAFARDLAQNRKDSIITDQVRTRAADSHRARVCPVLRCVEALPLN